MTEPDVLGLVLPTRDQARLARQVQRALDRTAPEALFLRPDQPGAAAVVDLAGLWNTIRVHDRPWATTDAALSARIALATLVLTGSAGRLKTCAAPGCRHVFADPTNATNRTRCSRHLRARPAR